MAEVRINIKTVQEGGESVPRLNDNLKQVVGTVTGLTAGVAAAGVVFKQAFDLSKEGANLLQLESSFDLLNERIIKTPDLLEDMQDASRGTMTDAQLMQGVLKLVAGTSEDMAQQLAAASPQLIEIAKAAQKLNPTLGDTAFLYESITTGIKRGSPMILDNLGIVIKVEEAYQKYAASIGTTADQLDAEQKSLAILNATLASGDTLIQQVGGSVDSQTDAWAQLEVMVQENTNAFKMFLAEGLSPTLAGVANTIDAVGEASDEGHSSLRNLVVVMAELGRFGGRENVFDLWAESLEESDAAMVEAIESDERMIRIQEELAAAKAAANEPTQHGTALMDMYGASAAAAAEESRKLTFAFQAQQQANIDANAALVSGFQAAEEPIQAFLDAQKLSMESQGEWVQVTRTHADEIADISEELAGDLNDDQRKAWEEILDNNAEGGAEWLTAWKALQADLTDTQRAELIAQRADLEAAGDEIGSAYTGSIEDMQAAKDAAIAANEAIIASYQELALEGSLAIAEASPDPEAFQRALDYAVAVGSITQAEADMREEVANTRAAIEDLNTMVVQNGLDTETAAKAYELLTTGEATAADEAIRLAEEGGKIGESFLQSLPGIDELINRLDSLDGRHVRVTGEVAWSESGTPPQEKAGHDKDGGGGGGNTSGGKGSGGKPGFAGAGLMSASGFDDQYGQSSAQYGNDGGWGGVVIQGDVIVNPQSGQNGQEIAQQMIQELGRLTRQQMRGR